MPEVGSNRLLRSNYRVCLSYLTLLVPENGVRKVFDE